MTLISNSATGRFSTDVVEVMDHIRKPVFVDNAIHHAISKIRIDDKVEIEIEKSNSINFQVTNEKNYLLVEGQSAVQISHHSTPGHSFTGNPFFGDNVVSSTNIPMTLYSQHKPSNRLTPSTVESANVGINMNLRNMKARSLSDIGFEDSTVKLGQSIDVGFRTSDLALRMGDSIANSLTSVNIGLPRKSSSTNAGRRMHSQRFLAQDFYGLNLSTALKYISRHDNRMVVLDRFGNLLYIPYRFSETNRKIDSRFRIGSKIMDPIDNTVNRVAVQGKSLSLNANAYAKIDDGEKQGGEHGEILETLTPILDMTVSNTRSARRVARQILKANSLIKGSIKTTGHFLVSDLRPGMTIMYDNKARIITEARHYLDRKTSDLVLMNIDTGLEGVLSGITEGTIALAFEENPNGGVQIISEDLGFFGKVDLKVSQNVILRGVGDTRLLIGGTKGTKKRGTVGKNAGLPIGSNKSKWRTN
jgi:hypothetical protein